METETLVKTKKSKPTTDSLRIKKETKKRILNDLALINKKDFGRTVTPDDLIATAIGLLKDEHFEQLKAQSLSNKDRLEKSYQDYCKQSGKISKDEYLGLLISNMKGNTDHV